VAGVKLGGAPGMTVTLDTGESWHVSTGNRDLIAWDRTAPKHRWPAFKDAPFLWVTFLAWHASRRQGLLPDPKMTYEAFEAAADQIDPDDDEPDDDTDDGAAAGEVDPTPPGHVPG
jgi:hypothetical protein